MLVQIVILISQIRVNSMAIVRMKSYDDRPPNQFGDTVPGGSPLTSSVEQVCACYQSRPSYLCSWQFVQPFLPAKYSCILSFAHSHNADNRVCDLRLGSGTVKTVYSFWKTSILFDVGAVKLKRFPTFRKGSSSESHLQVGKLSSDYIDSVAYLALQKKNRTIDADPGYCLKCGSYRDLESSCAAVDEAWIYIKRLEDSIVSREISSTIVLDALRSLHLLRTILHAYNKAIAKTEDNLAQAFSLVGDLQSARDHCKASIEILEKLYEHNHIAIGYELVKLSSIQLSLGDRNVVDNINQLEAIFLRYYGSQADTMFPNLQSLREMALKLVQ
ncbi:hypothetical protein Pint_05246 [Pistacia integerrima]|uniref:Uncharacterized protein n=1 Tax=Pistacia integerrima TaxID=434235 RepID=A0ACC0Z3S2_9ROSI|nr:hypothetical protein Pint_05246 [Pistacia integerrima]